MSSVAILGLAVAFAAGAEPLPGRHSRIEAELAADLMGWASRFSGLPDLAPAEPPTLVPLSPGEMQSQVCPESPAGCPSLVAVYDTSARRVLYRASLDMRDPTDQSFIVHELVHHLQHQHRGDAIFASCAAIVESERQAYAAQNQYQQHFRQWQRMGEVMRFMHCDEPAGAAEPVVRFGGSPAGPPDR